jgi:flagellar basal body-associated protein FliL
MDDDFAEPKKKKASRFGSIKVFLVLLIIGIAIGAFLEHQYIEPMINSNAKALADCSNTKSLLNIEIEDCYKQLADLNSQTTQLDNNSLP